MSHLCKGGSKANQVGWGVLAQYDQTSRVEGSTGLEEEGVILEGSEKEAKRKYLTLFYDFQSFFIIESCL